MNASKKGRDYENAYRHVLEARGYFVVRSAASKGPWDLWAWRGYSDSDFLLVQLKNQASFGCVAADRLRTKLYMATPTPVFATVRVVHPHKKERFCEH